MVTDNGKQWSEFLAAFLRMSLCWPNAKATTEMAMAYWQVLGGLPLDVVVGAMKLAAASSRFMPAASELRDLAIEAMRRAPKQYTDQTHQLPEHTITDTEVGDSEIAREVMALGRRVISGELRGDSVITNIAAQIAKDITK